MVSLRLCVVLVCVCCVEECVCFPNGSVAFSCGSLTPDHPNYMPSTSSPPFNVSTSSSTYRPGGAITVMVQAVTNSSSEFMGFMLQARSMNGKAVPVGKFTNIDPSQFTALHCQDQQNSTVSQASGVQKKLVQVIWEAPGSSNYGDIFFSATVVQDYSNFWVGLSSRTLSVESSSAAGGVFSTSTLFFISLLSLPVYC